MHSATRVDTFEAVEGVANFTPRLTRRQQVAVDGGLAALFAGLSVTVILKVEALTPAGAGWDVARGVAILLECAPLVLRRRYPRQVLAAVTAGAVVAMALGTKGPAIISLGFAGRVGVRGRRGRGCSRLVVRRQRALALRRRP